MCRVCAPLGLWPGGDEGVGSVLQFLSLRFRREDGKIRICAGDFAGGMMFSRLCFGWRNVFEGV
jgi:hypothetical protein